jgi:hypothetical protein
VYVIGTDPTGTHMLHGPVSKGRLSGLATVAGDVVTAAFGPDDRLRLILDDHQGLALVTLDR